MSKMSFEAAKAAVKADIEREMPDCSLHAVWINCKLGALAAIKTEADLATPEEIALGIGKMDQHLTVSKQIRALIDATACRNSSTE